MLVSLNWFRERESVWEVGGLEKRLRKIYDQNGEQQRFKDALATK